MKVKFLYKLLKIGSFDENARFGLVNLIVENSEFGIRNSELCPICIVADILCPQNIGGYTHTVTS